MPVIKYREKLDLILRKPVFSLQDLRHEGVSANYAKKLLFMLAKSGRIKRIERGRYTRLDDPIAVGAHITHPCYLSLWTAMSIRNLTDQIPFSVEVVTSRKRFSRKINFLGTSIIFHVVKPKMMFGFENIVWKDNIRVPVANREKIAVDAVYFNVPEDEILQIIKVSDVSLLERYAELTGNKKVMDKIRGLIKCSRRKK